MLTFVAGELLANQEVSNFGDVIIICVVHYCLLHILDRRNVGMGRWGGCLLVGRGSLN